MEVQNYECIPQETYSSDGVDSWAEISAVHSLFDEKFCLETLNDTTSTESYLVFEWIIAIICSPSFTDPTWVDNR